MYSAFNAKYRHVPLITMEDINDREQALYKHAPGIAAVMFDDAADYMAHYIHFNAVKEGDVMAVCVPGQVKRLSERLKQDCTCIDVDRVAGVPLLHLTYFSLVYMLIPLVAISYSMRTWVLPALKKIFLSRLMPSYSVFNRDSSLDPEEMEDDDDDDEGRSPNEAFPDPNRR
eukprot:Platyproteum_vivax@DN100_c0_g2_i2.p1